MSVSLYYTATRPEPLSSDEESAVAGVLAGYDLDEFVAEGGESFRFDRFDHESATLLNYSVGLPLGDEMAMFAALTRWLDLLAELHEVLPGAQWHVHLDDLDIPWSEQEAEFQLPQ